MKKILFILLLISIISCQKKQEKYVISGQLRNIPNETIIDLYAENDGSASRIKTDTIFDGYFEFSDTLSQSPIKMYLMIRDYNNFRGTCDLWVDYQKIFVKGDNIFLSSWSVESETVEQKILNEITQNTKHLSRKIDSLALIRSKNRENKDIIKVVNFKIDSIYKIKNSIEFNAIEKKPNSFIAIEKLYYILASKNSIPKDRVSEVYKRFDSTYIHSLYAEGILSILNKQEPPQVGDQLTDFEGYDINGNRFKLSDFKGKYILIDFWATNCGPCIQSIPELKEIHSKYTDNLIIVGFNLDTKEEIWEEGLKRDDVPWVNISDSKGIIAGIGFKYGILGFPTYFLINPEGKIVEQWEGYFTGNFEKKISQYMTKN
ncbi:MAG: hypothetical protein CVU00_00140 [Bacteroidetes bacterium HGW-Bacteroidetes-17]|jgi:thiol-disulfide isomerase/thioredoxin|nr:MAG: hypothetical protein CVU00_00140 [Bacteroidetes bacterium HGW-Bacteroidetes-17]